MKADTDVANEVRNASTLVRQYIRDQYRSIDRESLDAYYLHNYFNVRMEHEWRVRSQFARRENTNPVRTGTLLLTCGTQRYSIALSLLVNASQHILMVSTPDHETTAHQALDLVSAFYTPTVEFRVVDKDSSAEVYRHMKEFLVRGGAAISTDVRIDITSGTKAMTAAASAVAAALNLPQYYIASDLEFGFGFNDLAQQVEHPLTVFGDIQHAEAVRAFNSGNYDMAALVFEQLHAYGVRGYHFGLRAQLARAYSAWFSMQFQECFNAFNSVTTALSQAARVNYPDEPLLKSENRQLLVLQCQTAEHLATATSNPAGASLEPWYLVVVILYLLGRAETQIDRDPDLAVLLAYRATELAADFRMRLIGIDDLAQFWTDERISAYNAEAREKERHISSTIHAPTKLGLSQRLTLLASVKDSALASTNESVTTIINRLSARNSTIFAHGLTVVHLTTARTILSTARRICSALTKDVSPPNPSVLTMSCFQPIKLVQLVG